MVNGNVGFGKDEMCSYKHTVVFTLIKTNKKIIFHPATYLSVLFLGTLCCWFKALTKSTTTNLKLQNQNNYYF